MSNNWKYKILCFVITCLITSCTKPYTPTVITTEGNYLVVEGTINTGNDSTTIILSRTVALNSNLTTKPELGATITIQSAQGQSYNVTEKGNGMYSSQVLNLPNNVQYRLNIATTAGKTYVSDYVTPIATPPIDSIGFSEVSNKQEGTGLQIYVNTHDPNNNTHYYRWDYNETWMFNARYFSNFISNGKEIVSRPLSQQVYQCWANNISTNIELASSAKLSQDVIYQFPLIFIPATSEKLELRYSILLKQYALSADAYNYFSLLKQNTEELGSIFDAQPSQLTGNIHCTTNATLPVIGYISAGTIQQKRIYINNSQLPVSWIPTYPFDCTVDTALYKKKIADNVVLDEVTAELVPLPSTVTIITSITKDNAVIGYEFTEQDCGDCSIRGTTTQPSFWQN